jgi:hypothetical protein
MFCRTGAIVDTRMQDRCRLGRTEALARPFWLLNSTGANGIRRIALLMVTILQDIGRDKDGKRDFHGVIGAEEWKAGTMLGC